VPSVAATRRRCELKGSHAKLGRPNYVECPLTEYLKTPEWRALRNRVLIQAGNRCQVCGPTDKPLDVHHNSYERYGDELLEDLVALCRECHEMYHGRRSEAA
jgi:5-methylcytosine-specific restriction endonuclease McrA